MHDQSTFTYDQVKRAQTYASTAQISLDSALELIRDNDQADRIKQAKEYQALRNLNVKNMSKQEVIDATWKLPELPISMYELLKEQGGFMTGSNVISNINNPNDEDWCVQTPPSVFAEYSIGQSDNGYWEADGFSSVYCHYKGKLLNIICFSDYHLFYAWKFATETMSELMTKKPMKTSFNKNLNVPDLFATKWKRVILFRALKDIAYDPHTLRFMPKEDAIKYSKCTKCSREAIYFTCKAAKDHYLQTAVCERCAGITY